MVSLTPLPAILTDTLQGKTEHLTSTVKTESSDASEEPSAPRRRSSRIQSKESRALAESKIREEKDKLEKEVRSGYKCLHARRFGGPSFVLSKVFTSTFKLLQLTGGYTC